MDQEASMSQSFVKTFQFLGTSKLNVEELSSIAKLMEYSQKCSICNHMNGKDAETRALVWQWLEWCLTINNMSLETVCKRLGLELENHAFIIGNDFTLIDVIFYYFLESLLRNSSHQLRQTRFLNLSRWFNHVQNVEGMCCDEKKIRFLQNTIYS